MAATLELRKARPPSTRRPAGSSFNVAATLELRKARRRARGVEVVAGFNVAATLELRKGRRDDVAEAAAVPLQCGRNFRVAEGGSAS